jgi:hypothetical protein
MHYDKYHGAPFRKGDQRFIRNGLTSVRLTNGDWLSTFGGYVWLCTTEKGPDTFVAAYTVTLQWKMVRLPKALRGVMPDPMSPVGRHPSDRRPEVLRYIVWYCIPYEDLAPLMTTTDNDLIRRLALNRLSDPYPCHEKQPLSVTATPGGYHEAYA